MARRVYQTKFGGAEHPVAGQGDCMQASIATLLGLPLEEAFDANVAYAEWKSGGKHWWAQFEDWCRDRNLYPAILTNPLPVLGLVGVLSHHLRKPDGSPELHQVVAYGREVVHDPRTPGGEESYEQEPNDGYGDQWVYLIPCDPCPSDPLPALKHRPSVKPAGEAESSNAPTTEEVPTD